MSKNIYLLSNKTLPHTISLPMLEIEYLQSDICVNDYDAIVFTSKSAVQSINSFNTTWKEKDIYCIAPMTALEVEKLGVNVTFTGNSGHGNDFAKEILKNYKDNYNGKKLLYLRGDKVVSDLVDILKCDQKIIYKTICKQYDKKTLLPKNSIIIFSSPSTIQCFLEKFTWDSSFVAVSIGKTTAKYFPPYITPIVSKMTSLQSCVDIALKYY